MKIKLLGSAAGGGFPQWNCGCPQCQSIRAGLFAGRARTQSQVALSADGTHWVLLNASPDLRQQLSSDRSFDPRPTNGHRHTPIESILLTNADLDHTLGLLLMRESQPLHVHLTESVRKVLRTNSFFGMLEQFEGQCRWSDVRPGESFDLRGIRCTPIAVQGGFPYYTPNELASELDIKSALVGYRFEAGGRSFAFLPAVAAMTAQLLEIIKSSDLVFFDGTFWSDGELQKYSPSARTSRQMNHLPVSESLPRLAEIKKGRIVYTHINNTNPILDETSSERKAVDKAGLEVGFDGWEMEL